MRILVLGSAAGGGFPQWNCACAGCRRARAGDPAARSRTQSSVAVTTEDGGAEDGGADGGRWLLLNASPDLRAQIQANPALHPAPPAVGGVRASPLAAAILTNADIDHVAGLLSLRESQPFAVYATARVHRVLADNPMFQVLNPELVVRRLMTLGERFVPAGPDGRPLGVEVEAFAVPGKVALYLEDATAGAGFGSVPEDTVALDIRDQRTGARFFYIPGCAALPEGLAGRLRGAPLVLFDGTTWSDDEMIRTGTGTKTAARMGHMAMDGPEGTLAAFAGLDVRRKLFIHINNTNPVLLADTPERAAAEAAGWEITHDGMELNL